MLILCHYYFKYFINLLQAKLNTTDKSKLYRLLTSVSVPAFDTKTNKNNETRKANLLGVAGTDVSIDDILKLTLPYKVSLVEFY